MQFQGVAKIPITLSVSIDRLVHSSLLAQMGGIPSSRIVGVVDAIGERQDGPQKMSLFYRAKVGKP
jgi:hypothetical protein